MICNFAAKNFQKKIGVFFIDIQTRKWTFEQNIKKNNNDKIRIFLTWEPHEAEGGLGRQGRLIWPYALSRVAPIIGGRVATPRRPHFQKLHPREGSLNI